MSEILINVTKVEEVVTINATPNITQILVNTNTSGGGGIPDAPNNTNAYVRSGLAWIIGYTKTAIDNLLNGKFNNPTGNNTQYLDGTGTPTTFPTIPSISGLATETYVDNSLANKVDKETGKSLILDTEISRLASMTAIFTTTLKTAYDNAVSWISTNGTNVLNHLTRTDNPHSVTKSQVGLSNVPNTDTTTTANITDSINKRFVTDSNLTTIANTSGVNGGDETTATIQTKRPLKTIEGQSLEGSGNIDLTKSDVGLGNVDNTSDINKPISTATQTALNLKQNALTNPITGTGTLTKIPKFTGVETLGDSIISDDGSGVVDVGTNGTINTRLRVFSSVLNSYFEIRSAGSFGGINSFGLGNFQMYNALNSTGYFSWFTQTGAVPVERMRVNNAGNLLVNTTTNNGIDKIQVNGTISASPATTSNQVVVKSQLDSKVDKTSWVDYSETSTIVGFSSFTTKQIYCKKISDNVIWVKGSISGTSNSSLFNFTIPFTSANNLTNAGIAGITNGGANQGAVALSSCTSNSNVVNIYRDNAGTAFTTSGVKIGTFSILIEIQ